MSAHERPVIFNTEMVKAILAGRKTQTRRVMKPQPEEFPGGILWKDMALVDARFNSPYGFAWDVLWVREMWAVDAPLDQVRREHEDALSGLGHGPYFKTELDHADSGLMWKPSIHMPKWMSRIKLGIKDVRVERVQDISDEDAEKEGVYFDIHKGMRRWIAPGVVMRDVYGDRSDHAPAHLSAKNAFETLWNSINAKPRPCYSTWGGKRAITHHVSYPWDSVSFGSSHKQKPWYVYANPFCWVIEFEVLK